MDRRFFIKSSGISMASFGLMALAPNSLQQLAQAQTLQKRNGKILVTIFQRGAVDGLNTIVPHGESEYYRLRPSIAIPRPGKTGGVIDMDGFFGFHPSLEPLEPFWKNKELAVIHSAGSPDNTRSHFDAQDYMESGTPGVKSTRDGWLNRALQNSADKNATPFRAVAMTKNTPRTLLGRHPTIAMTNLRTFAVRAGAYSNSVQGGFEGIWQDQTGDQLSGAGKETFEAVRYLERANPAQYRPASGVRYPANELGSSLRQIAQLIKAGVGLEVAFAEMGGWDTHRGQGGSQGQLSNLLRGFAQAIAAFANDIGSRMNDIVILTMSEFGRTARENGSRGTDHGHGNAMITIGGSVNGGTVYGDWKGLKSGDLYQERDLAVTTDFRDVLGEISSTHLGIGEVKNIFPNHNADPANFRGILR